MDSALHASSGLGFWNITGSGFTWDADVLDWISRVQGQGSDTNTNTRLSMNSFVQLTKSYTGGLWDKLKRVGVYSGDSVGALKAPLKNTWGNVNDAFGPTDFTYAESTGAAGVFASQIGINTGLNPSVVATINDIHISVYSRTAGNETGSAINVVSGGTSDLSLLPRFASDTSYCSICSESTYTTATDTSGQGLYVGSRTASNSQKLYRNASLIGTHTTPGGSLPNLTIFVHCQINSLSTTNGTGKYLAWYSVGLGLDATDVSNLYSAVQALQTALGRNV
jgi:hypothetical protein